LWRPEWLEGGTDRAQRRADADQFLGIRVARPYQPHRRLLPSALTSAQAQVATAARTQVAIIGGGPAGFPVPPGRVSRWDKFFVMDDPPDYELAPEKSLATIAARSGRPPDEVAYDYITEADAYRYSVFGAFSHGNSGANACWDHEGAPSTCRCPRVGCYRAA
jgi:hypothetical protein